MVKFVRQVLHSCLHWHHDVTVAVKVILSMRSSVLLLLKMTLEFLKHSLSTNKTKQAHAVMHKYMYCKSTCSIDNFQGTIRICEKAMYDLESLAWPVYWPWESGMTCVLTLRVWHRQCTSSPQTPSGVSPCLPSAVWSVSRCPSVAPPGAWSFRPVPQIVAPLPVMQTILFSKSDLLSSKY